MSDIEVLEFRPIKNGSLKAFVDVRLGKTEIRDFRVVHKEGQKPWIACPQTTWKDPSGELKYRPIISFPKELKQLIDSAILDRYRRESGVKSDELF